MKMSTDLESKKKIPAKKIIDWTLLLILIGILTYMLITKAYLKCPVYGVEDFVSINLTGLV